MDCAVQAQLEDSPDELPQPRAHFVEDDQLIDLRQRSESHSILSLLDLSQQWPLLY